MSETTGRVLVSCPFASPWLEVDLPEGWVVRPRPSDFGVDSRRALVTRVTEVVGLVRAARAYDAVVLSTAAVELVLLCLARPLLRRQVLVAYDPLQPDGHRSRWVARWLARSLDLVLCVRRSDVGVWNRARRAEFVPFFAPSPTDGPPAASLDPVSVYSAGDAYRDYDLLVAAADGLSLEVTICTRRVVLPASDNVRVRAAVSPQEGRRMQQSSGISAVLLQDTDRPAGPVVLLEAMAVGAAIVCSRSAGLVDYVDDEVEALVLPAAATAADVRAALGRLAANPLLRRRLGEAARERLSGPLAANRTVERVRRSVAEVLRRE